MIIDFYELNQHDSVVYCGQNFVVGIYLGSCRLNGT